MGADDQAQNVIFYEIVINPRNNLQTHPSPRNWNQNARSALFLRRRLADWYSVHEKCTS